VGIAIVCACNNAYNLTGPKALLHIIPCVTSDKNGVKKRTAAAATVAPAFVALQQRAHFRRIQMEFIVLHMA